MRKWISIISSMLMLFVVQSCAAKNALSEGTIVLDYKLLQNNKQKKSSPEVKKALSELLLEANKMLKTSNLTVTSKTVLPPSNSKHDYLSRAPYWWPNPKTKNGLPYIAKDGQNNPERLKIKDLSHLIEMSKRVRILGLAFYFTGDKRYSDKVAKIVTTWFLDPQTKMNPNLNYGQSIPGVADGRIEGVIDTKYFLDVIDGVLLVREQIPKKTFVDFVSWFESFDNWLENSRIGRRGTTLKNNIGTAYLLQRLSYLRLQGRDEDARILLEKEAPRLMDLQFDSDGQQLLENKRTKSWSYNLANLKYWFDVAKIGDDLGSDICNVSTSGGSAMKKAYHYLEDFADGKSTWDKKQIATADFQNTFSSIRFVGSRKFHGIESKNLSTKASAFLLLTQRRF